MTRVVHPDSTVGCCEKSQLTIMANVKVISEWHSQRTDFLDFVELLKRGDRIEFQRAGYCHWSVYIGKCSVK